MLGSLGPQVARHPVFLARRERPERRIFLRESRLRPIQEDAALRQSLFKTIFIGVCFLEDCRKKALTSERIDIIYSSQPTGLTAPEMVQSQVVNPSSA